MSDLEVTVSMNDGGYEQTLNRIQAGLKKTEAATSKLNKETHETVSRMQAASAAARVFEGSLSIRSAEKFISLMPALSNGLLKAFPIIGAISLIEILEKGIGKMVDLGAAAVNAGSKMRDAFNSVAGATETSNAALQVTNDRLDDQIAKLTGKHPNALKDNLDEAREAADKLADSLQADSDKMTELLKKNSVSLGDTVGQIGAALLSGIGSSLGGGSIVGSNLGRVQLGTRQLEKDQANDAQRNTYHSELIHNATLDPSATTKSIQDAVNAAKTEVNRQITEYGKRIKELSSNPGMNATRIAGYEGLVRTDTAQLQRYDLEGQKGQKEIQVRQAEDAKRGAELAKAAMRAIQEAIIQGNRDQLEAIKADHATDLEEDRLYWYGKILTAKQGSKELESAQFNFNKTGKLINVRDSKQDEALDKATFGVGGDMDLSKDDGGMKDFQANSRISEENAHIANELATSIRDATAAFAEQNVQVALTTGNMSKYQAAAAMANIHAAQFDEKMNGANGLQYQLDNAKASGDPNQLSAATRAVNLAQIQRGTQIQSDSQAIALNTPLGAATDALRQFAQAANDTGTQLRELIGQALNGINSDIVNGKGFKQTGSDLAKSVSTMGLQKAEGSVLGAFGLGGKPDGSSSKPLYTIDVTPGAGANGGGFGGGILGKLFGGSKSSDSSSSDSSGGGGVMDSLSSIIGGFGGNSDGSDSDSGSGFGDSFQGFFANGGDVVPNKAAIVGDGGGPELFIPKTAGSIVSNKQLGNLGGDTHYHVDARGATDPSATAKMVQQAMMQTHKQSVSDSLKAQKETNLRKPPSARS